MTNAKTPSAAAVVVPLKRARHPPVAYRGKAYDTNCAEFIHANAEGDFLYWEPALGYLLVSIFRPTATVFLRGGRRHIAPSEPHYRIDLLVQDRSDLL